MLSGVMKCKPRVNQIVKVSGLLCNLDKLLVKKLTDYMYDVWYIYCC